MDFQIVIYDEIEKFREYDDPQFSYPYEDRKIQVNSYTLDVEFFELKDFEYKFDKVGVTKELINYEYFSQQVIFQKSYVCLESHYMNILLDFIPSVKQLFQKLFKMPYEQNENCDGEEF